ncbi:MAG: hypothetical protein R2860_05310 [Desulfobacterales bacterium]
MMLRATPGVTLVEMDRNRKNTCAAAAGAVIFSRISSPAGMILRPGFGSGKQRMPVLISLL